MCCRKVHPYILDLAYDTARAYLDARQHRDGDRIENIVASDATLNSNLTSDVSFGGPVSSRASILEWCEDLWETFETRRFEYELRQYIPVTFDTIRIVARVEFEVVRRASGLVLPGIITHDLTVQYGEIIALQERHDAKLVSAYMGL